MLIHHLKVAVRNYLKNQTYAILNTLGLGLAFAAFMLCLIYVHYERSFENFHTKGDRIYRVTYRFSNGSGYDVHWSRVPVDYINQLPNDFAGVKELIRFQNHEQKYIRVGENKFSPKWAFQADSSVFRVFDFELLEGDPNTALAIPHSVVLSESLARKYFPDQDPIGLEIMVTGHFQATEQAYVVRGVMKDVPGNTHLPAELFFSYQSEAERTWWAYTYILLEEGTDIATIEAGMEDFITKYGGEGNTGKVSLYFQPLPDIHLHSDLARELKPGGNELYVNIFLFVGIFILLIAIINYVNLSSAISLGRLKETGMRMILGAGKGQLIRYVLVESVFYNLLSLMLGFVIARAVFPWFQQMVQVELVMNIWVLSAVMVAIALICGLLGGIYPAIILTATSALQMTRHSRSFVLADKRRPVTVQKFLVLLQFTVFVLLTGSAFMVQRQISYIRDLNLGLEKEQVLAMGGIPNPVTDKYPEFREQVASIPGVVDVSACMEVPSREIRDVGPLLVEGGYSDPSQAPMMDVQVISPGFIDMMKIEILAGEDATDRFSFGPLPEFSEEYSPAQYLGDLPRSYMINETGMKLMGWQTPDEALGKRVSWSIGGFTLAMGPITGVVKDFHQETLKNKVDPTILVAEQIWFRTILIKLETAGIQETIGQIQEKWDQLFPSYPMNYEFLDDLYNELYQGERIQLNLLLVFSGLAMLIAFLGLFSLIAFSLRTRVKEMAIRRILGAGFSSLMGLIGKEYLWVMAVSSVIAVPVSIYWVSQWLEKFAYRTEISPLVYLLTLMIVLGLLLITISIQMLRLRRINPADTLRDE